MTPSITTVMSATAGTVANSGVKDIRTAGLVSVQVNYTDATPANKGFASTDVDTAANTIAITAHGLFTGTTVTLTTAGTLPTGLVTSTPYWIIAVDANTVAFATSLANASAGTKIDLTGVGAGNSTIVVTALSGLIKIQASNDGTTWNDITSATVTITATGTTMWGLGEVDFIYLKSVFTPTAGALTYSVIVSEKKDQVAL